MVDRSTVRVMRDGRPNSVDSNRILSNNITSEAMERVSGRMGRMRNPKEEVEPRSRLARRAANYMSGLESGMKKGGAVKKMAAGGSVASKRADGCAARGKTKGRMV
jgi:hypothetical protein